MKRYLTSVLFISAAISFASGAEKKIQMKDLPEPVRKAVAEHSKGATLRGLSKEVDNGKTEYEAELGVNGHIKDVSFDPTGAVVSVEEEVTLDSVPPAVRSAIQKEAGNGTVRKLEFVTEGDKSFYEASIRKGGKTTELQVDANGARI